MRMDIGTEDLKEKILEILPSKKTERKGFKEREKQDKDVSLTTL
jgi:hypothetical protein